MKKYTCIAVDDSKVQLVLLKNYLKKIENIILKQTFDSPMEAYHYLSQNEIDILLLDIDMPEMSGLDLLKILSNPPQTILITSKTEFALEAFELDAIDYIVKPPEYPRLLKALNKAITFIEKRQNTDTQIQEDSIFIKTAGKLLRIEVDNIEYFEAMSDYVIIHTEDKRSHIVYSTMKDFENKMLIFKRFYRIHRSYLVHLQKIKSIENGQVLINDKYLPIGNTYKEEFLAKLNKI
ncbi:MAG: LytR/AlgR family response regulator transcription factor [Raineya sp.]